MSDKPKPRHRQETGGTPGGAPRGAVGGGPGGGGHAEA